LELGGAQQWAEAATVYANPGKSMPFYPVNTMATRKRAGGFVEHLGFAGLGALAYRRNRSEIWPES
jgi:hypothetical protein